MMVIAVYNVENKISDFVPVLNTDIQGSTRFRPLSPGVSYGDM